MSEPNITEFLVAQPNVAQLTGTNIFPLKMRQGARQPVIVWAKTGAVRDQTYCGTQGLVRGSFQLDIYATTKSVLQELLTAVMDSMLDFSGEMGECIVKACTLTTDFDSVDPDPGLLRRTQLWDIWYVER